MAESPEPDEETRRLEEEVEHMQAQQGTAAHSHELSPSAFVSNFRGYIEAIKEKLEAEYGDDAGRFESPAQRAEYEAQFTAARNWLVERWGVYFPCPVCQNVEWTISEVGPAFRPVGYLSFHVTCGYCGNTMQVVPGNAPMDAPRLHDQQLHFPAPE